MESLLSDSQREGIVTVLRAVFEKFLVMGLDLINLAELVAVFEACK